MKRFRKTLSIFLAVLLLCGAVIIPQIVVSAATSTVYLDASAVRTDDDVKWGAWTWNTESDGVWKEGTDSSQGYYKFTDIKSNVIFARFDTKKTIAWGNQWNQTDDIPVKSDLYKIEDWGQDGGNLVGRWSSLSGSFDEYGDYALGTDYDNGMIIQQWNWS